MDDRMVDVERRVKRYWYEDGIVEIAIGGLFFVLGMFFGLQGYFGEDSKMGGILSVSMVVVMMGGIFGTQWLVNTLKTRFTYPRTGYVEYRARDKGANQARYLIIAVALIITIASIVLINFIRGLDSMVLASGLMVGVVFIALRGKSSGVTRFYIMGICSILLGVGLSFDDLSQANNLAIFYGLLGIAMMVIGSFVLRNYVRDNPMPEGEEDVNG